MKTIITARHFDLTEGLRTYIEDRFQKFEKTLESGQTIKVTLTNEKNEKKAEAMFTIKGHLLHVEEVHDDMYVAIDLVVTKLKHQLTKIIDKNKSKRKNKESIRFTESAHLIEEVEPELNPTKQIVKRKSFGMKPMMEEEAILQMELLRHDTFMFFNAEIESMCLLYKRKDGNYGLIEGAY